MSKKPQTNNATKQIERAQFEVEVAKKRFTSTVGALQYRLKPATLANQAWSEVREKGSVVADDAFHSVNDMADGAVRAVRDRPIAASGVAAALVIFLARAPLWRAARGLFGKPEDQGVIKANLEDHEGSYDLTAPTVERSQKEGVNA